jgi:hypothetical protein
MEDETVLQPWDQQPDEPDEMYRLFVNYYLAVGFARTLRRAYSFFLASDSEPGRRRLFTRVPDKWQEAFEDWKWFERAKAYDDEELKEARAQVRQAQLDLQMKTVEAVQALIRQLDSPRNAVSAAKEILDRGGIPARSIQDVNQKVEISSDMMAEAAKEVEEWEQKLMSGSNADDQLSTSSIDTA